MSPDPTSPNRYIATLDLTTRAQEQASAERAEERWKNDIPSPKAEMEKLPAGIRSALQAMGWEGLMPVQEETIPLMLEGKDAIVQSRTGSGKTGAFLLPLFDLLDPSRDEAQVLILTPTRELAKQIFAEFERMKAFEEGGERFKAVSVYGGVKYAPQMKALKEGAQVVVGTPGRILDHLERRTLSLQQLRVLVLDEADEMLSMGFYPAMRQLKRHLPDRRHSYMFSATIPPRVQSLAREFLDEPTFLSLSRGNISVAEIEHRYHVVAPMEKDRALARLIEMENPDSAIIFANTKRDVDYIDTFLKNYGYDADAISGDLTQQAREAVMDRVRTGSLRFLVATDVAARGIDITDLSHVIMYDVPQDPEYYIHRSGRTARAGKTGTAIVLTSREDEPALTSIARRYGIELNKQPLPSAEDVEARVAERMTVILEEAMREKSNLERERLRRFTGLVTDLAREEPELLAMLVDGLYHRHLHPRTSMAAPPDPETETPPRVLPRPKRQGGRAKRR